MKNLIIFLIAVSTLFTSNLLNAQAATVTEEKEYRSFKMNDGRMYKGEVVKRTDTEITVKDEYGEEITFKKDEVKRTRRMNTPKDYSKPKKKLRNDLLIVVPVLVLIAGTLVLAVKGIVNGLSDGG